MYEEIFAVLHQFDVYLDELDNELDKTLFGRFKSWFSRLNDNVKYNYIIGLVGHTVWQDYDSSNQDLRQILTYIDSQIEYSSMVDYLLHGQTDTIILDHDVIEAFNLVRCSRVADIMAAMYDGKIAWCQELNQLVDGQKHLNCDC